MRKVRKIMLAIFVILGIVICPAQVHAETDLFDVKESVTENSGQISLDSAKLLCGNRMDELEKLYPHFSTVIEEHFAKYKSLPSVIGWTNIPLTLVSSSSESYVIPTTQMTRLLNVSQRVHHSPYGNLTLYTAASFRGSDIYASSVAQYSTLSAAINDRPARGMYDYISISFPTAYTIDPNYGISTGNYGSYAAAENENGAAMGVMPDASPSAKPYTYVVMNGIGKLNGVKPNICKVISTYTHNYNTIRLSVNLSPSTGSISVSPTNRTWTVTSSVTL